MTAPASAETIKDVNARYHDVAADTYDAKWGISYEENGRHQVTGKLRKALGRPIEVYERGLEIGAGTGYFTLNLMQSGVVRSAVATDISQGMLDALAGSAARLGLDVETVCTESEALPFPDNSFDIVYGHAILHHLPDLDASFREFRRVLKPGGVIAFAGEPSHHGDRLASYPKQAALRVAPLWRRLVGVAKRQEEFADQHEADEHALEHIVDVHAFTPGDLTGFAQRAGFENVRVSGEELVAGWFGWANRTLESTAEHSQIPMAWFKYAYHGYLALKVVDERVLEPRMPSAIFYNLLMSARVPAAADEAPADQPDAVAAAASSV